MPLAHAILGFLSEGPKSGYDLKTRCFDGPLSGLWTADQAQVYRTLDRLESAGLVSSTAVPQRGKPDRKTYEVTARGRGELTAWLSSPHALLALRDPLLLQLWFSDDAPSAALLSTLTEARGEQQRRLESLRRKAAGEKAGRRMALLGAAATARAAVDWLDDCIEEVSSGPRSRKGLTDDDREES